MMAAYKVPLADYVSTIRVYDDADEHAVVQQVWRNAIAAGYKTDEVWTEIYRQDEEAEEL